MVENKASIAVSLEDIKITLSIEAQKGRDVATIDITKSYLHTKSYEGIIMTLKV